MKKFIYTSILLLLLTPCILAQVTSVNHQVQIQNLSRNVAVSIPSSYSPTNPTPLIISLHGFNMSGSGLENYLKNFAQQQQILIANIDGAGNRHDDQLNGLEINVILSTIDSMKNWYNIDTNRLLLFGFSYGGRESLYFGSTYPNLFSGIITHSAAIQSSADVNNQLSIPWANPFQYANLGQIPICNCMGNNDQNFGPFIQQFQNRLGLFSTNDTLIQKNGIGHTIFYNAFYSDMQDCWNFIQRQNQLSTSLKERSKIEQSTFYPNPSTGELYTKAKNLVIQEIRDIKAASINYTYQNGYLTIEGKAGTYFILYKIKDQLKSQKIILQ